MRLEKEAFLENAVFIGNPVPMNKKFRNQGLPSLNESAQNRRRQIVTGRARLSGGIPPKLFLSGLGVLVLGGIILFFQAQAELNESRNAILKKQRATAQVLVPKLEPLREKVEKYSASLAEDGRDYREPGVNWEKVLSAPSLYLRTRLETARNPESLRKSAEDSLRDGFTACLLRDLHTPSPTAGKECRVSSECAAGELCNEYQHCARPSSPYNMRLLYRALHVLSDEWAQQVKDAGNEYKLIAFDRGLDSVTQVDIPIAIDVHQAAKYAVVVVDEDPKDGLPAALEGEFESERGRLLRVPHPARVGIWELEGERLLARVSEQAEGQLRAAGTAPPPTDPQVRAAQARMANSCGLALSVRARLGR